MNSDASSSTPTAPASGSAFPSTQWSVVLRVGAESVAEPKEVDAELRHLIAAVGGKGA